MPATGQDRSRRKIAPRWHGRCRSVAGRLIALAPAPFLQVAEDVNLLARSGRAAEQVLRLANGADQVGAKRSGLDSRDCLASIAPPERQWVADFVVLVRGIDGRDDLDLHRALALLNDARIGFPLIARRSL